MPAGPLPSAQNKLLKIVSNDANKNNLILEDTTEERKSYLNDKGNMLN